MMRGWFQRAFTRVIKPTCPHCNADIPAGDISLASGTMLCRACGHIACIATGSGTEAEPEAGPDWSPDGPPVPPPSGTKVRFAQAADSLVLQRRTGSIGAGAFMLLWLCGWTVGCVFLVNEVLTKRSPEMILFSVPFLAAWFFVAAMVVCNFAGFEELRIDRDGVHYRWGAGRALGHRSAPVETVRQVGRFAGLADSDSGYRPEGLRIETSGKPIRFAKGASNDELRWMADAIRRQVYALSPGAMTPPTAVGPVAQATPARTAAPPVEILQPPSAPPAPPPDAKLQLRRELNQTEFYRRGAAIPAGVGVAGLTFVLLFWNGIVSVFVWQLVKDFQWFLALFLVPFVAVGLGILGGWLAMVTSPFWRTSWVFRPGFVAKRFSIFGIGRTKEYELGPLARLELRRTTGRRKLVRRTGEDEVGDRQYALALVKRDGADLIEIAPLTEGEGRWMAAELFRDFRGWFVKVGP